MSYVFYNSAPGEPPIELFVRVLLVHCNSKSALQRTVTSFVITAWPLSCNGLQRKSSLMNGKEIKEEKPKDGTLLVPKSHLGLSKRLLDCLNENIYFDEIALGFTKLQSECKDFVATLKHYGVPLRTDIENVNPKSFFSFDQIETLASSAVGEGIQRTIKKKGVVENLMERSKTIHNIWSTTTYEFASLNTL